MNFGAKFRHAFAVDGEKAEPTPEQSAAVDAFARWVARYPSNLGPALARSLNWSTSNLWRRHPQLTARA